jgi:hypothetical protein
MDRTAALALLGLRAGARPEEIETAFRAARKPLLKELNRHDAGKEPPQLLARLEQLEAARRLLTAPGATAPTPDAAAADAADDAADDAASGDASDGDDASGEAAAPAEEAEPVEEEVQAGTRGTQGTAGGTRGTIRPLIDAGALLLERFEVRELISHRPEGDSYRVRDRVRDVEVMLKIVDPALVRDGRVRARLRRDLLAARRAHHARIARVLDVHELQHTLVVISELPAGENLWDRLFGRGTGPDPLPAAEVRAIAGSAARGLAALHDVMPHGALRPESVWVADDGGVKLSDHGYANMVAGMRERRLSRTKLGTAYWAPEQYRDAREGAEASDQHALALILYEALSGKPALGRTTKISAFRRDVPARLRSAIERALSTKSARRFADMDAFGAAAQAGYTSEHTVPSGLAPTSVLVPLLGGLALVVGAAFSPLGAVTSDALQDAVGRWHATADDETEADAAMRSLRALALRLGANREALGAEGGAELDRIVGVLTTGTVDRDQRQTLREDLASLVGQVVATARRGAHEARGRADAAWNALDSALHGEREAADAASAEALEALRTGAGAKPLERLLAVARAQARHERLAIRRDAARHAVLQGGHLLAGERAVRTARSALDIGDESGAGRAFDAATAAYDAATEAATAALSAFKASAPPAAVDATMVLDEKGRKALLDTIVDTASSTTARDLGQVLSALKAAALAGVQGRFAVEDGGAFAFEAGCDPQAFAFAGTWADSAAGPLLRVTLLDDAALPSPLEFAARRGESRPALADLLAIVPDLPRNAQALWCARRGSGPAPAAPLVPDAERVVKAGEVLVQGTWEGPADGVVLVDGVRAQRSGTTFEARAQLAGDMLGTALRAHGLVGLRSGPAALVRVRVDGLKPRLHLLEPALGSTVAAGGNVTVRVLVYDTHLARLLLAGEEQALRADDLYVLIERTMKAPTKGSLKLPLSATDAAGNTEAVEWEWAVR